MAIRLGLKGEDSQTMSETIGSGRGYETNVGGRMKLEDPRHGSRMMDAAASLPS